MSASEPPGDPGRRGGGRGRGQGRPSKVEALRRQAYREALDEDEAAVPGQHLAPSPQEIPLALGLPIQDAPAVPSVPRHLIESYRQVLPALPTNPLGKIVTQYANAAEHQLSELQQEAKFKFATEFWSPAQNVWDSAPLVAQAAARGMTAQRIRRSERRLAAAAELAERERRSTTLLPKSLLRASKRSFSALSRGHDMTRQHRC